MNTMIHCTNDYLYFPVFAGRQTYRVTISLKNTGEKIYEFLIPVAAKECEPDFYAMLPISSCRGENLVISGECPDYYLNLIYCDIYHEPLRNRHPIIHFCPSQGWGNDPNGLVYADGCYHMYFQYNPFDIRWKNMSWGHAVSRDLLHWTELDPVLFPTSDGEAFSGCGLTNERGTIDFLPEDALIFFYTCAGRLTSWSEDRPYCQKMAYSTDGGRTLQTYDRPVVPEIFEDSRDPKVFYHEKSSAYIMTLWLQNSDYGIFRSTDLLSWNLSSMITFKGEMECPDLVYLTDSEGEGSWFFWTPGGHYYPGTFDGYTFIPDGSECSLYATKLSYAAQTYSGTPGRTIQIPWLKTRNDGRLFTGCYGIPTELSMIKTPEGSRMLAVPIREMRECCEYAADKIWYPEDPKTPLYTEIELKQDSREILSVKIGGSGLVYDPESGKLTVDLLETQFPKHVKCFQILTDDRILEVFADGGILQGTFELKDTYAGIEILSDTANSSIYEVK